jgi:hypothetical protein
MSAEVSTDQVWDAIEKELFAVVGMVSAGGQARTVGVVYITRNRKLYFVTGRETWKARHIAANQHVSVTVPISKHIPLLPWIRIPSATITFCGTARISDAPGASPELLKALFRHKAEDRELVEGSCIIEVTPEKDFITYGVGIPMYEMRDPYKARGRVAVA